MTNELVIAAIAVLIQVESHGRVNARGDGGRAIGILQIHPEMVEEVNRLSARNITLNMRRDPKASILMAAIFLEWARKHYDIKTVRELCWRWNKPTTGRPSIRYMKRVDDVLNRLQLQGEIQ